MKPLAYYNENDPKCAAWLRELIRAGHIANGDVDERSIEDVRPGDLAGYRQCHFFAGIGGWSYALRLAGWPDDQPVWTGSCPCQPFSAAGKGAGFADERHLWPAWFHLIRQCEPGVVFGEQVASRDGLGWLDLVHADLEGAGYACGAIDLCAAGVGAPHIRQRLWFVADANVIACGQRRSIDGWRNTGSDALPAERTGEFLAGSSGVASRMGITDCAGSQSRREAATTNGHWSSAVATSRWSNAEWIDCRDGKRRPVEPGTFPLAHGVPERVVRLRGYGNAIVPQLAATFIEAYLEATGKRVAT